MIHCPACRTELPNYARFCRHCGHTFSAAVATDGESDTERLPLVRAKSLNGNSATPVSTEILKDELSAREQSLNGARAKAGGATPAPTGDYTSSKMLARLPLPVQHVIVAVLVRARDAEPEVCDKSSEKARETWPVTWGWFPVLA